MEFAIGRKLLVPAGIQSLLSDLVHERTGIFFEPERVDILVEKLSPLACARECFSLLDYYYLLKYEKYGEAEWDRVMDALSVQETYFWREMAQVRVMVDVLVPQWFGKTSAPLRIWSAASASGEEPFSLAMALVEAGWGTHPIEIVASDASPTALEKCRAALYRENSFRGFPRDLREKYFRSQGNEWQLIPEITRRVAFHRANLAAADEISPLARSPVVFCRNVFIYFSSHSVRQTLAVLASRMPRGGHLFVGISESLLRLTADFELREIGDAFVYVRV